MGRKASPQRPLPRDPLPKTRRPVGADRQPCDPGTALWLQGPPPLSSRALGSVFGGYLQIRSREVGGKGTSLFSPLPPLWNEVLAQHTPLPPYLPAAPFHPPLLPHSRYTLVQSRAPLGGRGTTAQGEDGGLLKQQLHISDRPTSSVEHSLFSLSTYSYILCRYFPTHSSTPSRPPPIHHHAITGQTAYSFQGQPCPPQGLGPSTDHHGVHRTPDDEY